MNYEELGRQIDEGLKNLGVAIEGAINAINKAFNAYDKAAKPEKLNYGQASAVIRCWAKDNKDKG